MTCADDIQRDWYRAVTPPWWQRVLASLFGAGVRLRAALHRRGWLPSVRLPVPVVVVGNINVGGTGKTPLVIALAAALRNHGFTPGVVSRGYGGSERDARLLGVKPDPARFGDEPCLISARIDVPVAVGRDRVAAARLLQGQGVDVIVSDDGLQHYRLQRDIEICVIDGARRFGNGRLLPAGPLREPLTRLASVDYRICTGGTARDDEIPMRFTATTLVALNDAACCQSLTAWAGRSVHAVAGIGYPPRFFASLREQGIEVIEHPFADHHAYVAADLAFDPDLPIVMTEKDAIKCARFDVRDAWVLPVDAKLPAGFMEQLAQRLRLD